MGDVQHRIIDALGTRASIDPAVEVKRRVDFLVRYAESATGSRGFVLGISGGQDSSLAGRLVQLATVQLRERGTEAEFIAVRLPYAEQSDEEDAQLALGFIEADRTVTVNIAPATDALVSSVDTAMGTPMSDFNKGNAKARMRMIAQYAIAGDRGLLVVGTDHAAEAVTGFYTKFGDGAADVLPLAGLTKSQGAALLQHLNAPERLWQKAPTADLLDGQPGQTDESSLGLRYADIDAYLTGEHISEVVAEKIEHRYRGSEHKRRPPVGPSDDWWVATATSQSSSE